MRQPWKPGNPCPKCNNPVDTQADRYKNGTRTCKPCGNKAKQEERDAERAPLAILCRDCYIPMIDGNDRRYGACLACRQKQRVRYCDCGGEIRAGSKTVRCHECTARRRAAGTVKATAALAETRNGQRELREATRGPVDVPRPYHAPDGLRGGLYPALSTVEGEAVCPKRAAVVDAILSRRWATLDGGRI